MLEAGDAAVLSDARPHALLSCGGDAANVDRGGVANVDGGGGGAFAAGFCVSQVLFAGEDEAEKVLFSETLWALPALPPSCMALFGLFACLRLFGPMRDSFFSDDTFCHSPVSAIFFSF